MSTFKFTVAGRPVGKYEPRVPLISFGKDHWSTFAYLETVCVDHRGEPDKNRMRTDPKRHPGLVGSRIPNMTNTDTLGERYPTRLRWNERLGHCDHLEDHDDWDCVDDLEAIGLLEWKGTGINPVFKITPLGAEIAGQLRRHKALGKNFCEFTPRMPVDA